MFHRRHNFPAVQTILGNLVRALKKIPSDQVLDMDNVLSRESLDVIGRPHSHFKTSKCLLLFLYGQDVSVSAF